MKLRIAVSGSAGTGKTTLGRALAERIGVPFIEEGMRARIEQGLKFHELTDDQRRALIVELWEEQREAELRAGERFVADRSAYDYIAFWLHYGLHHDVEASDRWIQELATAGEGYERVLLLPWGVLPLEEDGVRSTNPWIQFHYQALLEATLNRFTQRAQVLQVPGEETLEQRLEFSLRFLPVGGGPAGGSGATWGS